MKAILMSIRPKWVAKILNGEKTIEIRKRFPKDFKGWVYIYCTYNGNWVVGRGNLINGSVIARFWCDKVEKYYNRGQFINEPKCYLDDICENACLTRDELDKYCEGQDFYAIHISNLEIFDEPKELNEFYGYTNKKVERYTGLPKARVLTSLKKAPQSRQYIEVEK